MKTKTAMPDVIHNCSSELANELSTSAVANDQQSMHKMTPTIMTLHQDYQQHLQKNNMQFRTLTVHFLMQLYQRRKTLHFFRTVYLE